MRPHILASHTPTHSEVSRPHMVGTSNKERTVGRKGRMKETPAERKKGRENEKGKERKERKKESTVYV